MGHILLDSVHPRIAGGIKLKPSVFKRKLGETAFIVWLEMCTHRNVNGVCLLDYCRFRNLSTNQILKATKRLRKLGLVSKARRTDKGYERQIFGARGLCNTAGEVIFVTACAYKLIDRANSWGGKRDNSGRSVSSELSQVGPLENIVKVSGPESCNIPEAQVQINQVALPGNQVALGPLEKNQVALVPISVPVSKDTTNHLTNRVLKDVGMKRAISLDHSIVNDLSSLPSEGNKDAPPPEAVAAHLNFLFSRLRGRKPQTRFVNFASLPPPPTDAIVPPAELPPPPLLDFETTPGEQVEFLAKAYENAFSRHCKKRCWVFKRGVLSSKYFDLISEGAVVLIEHKIRPAVWLEFSFEVWSDKHNLKKSPPPINFIYSPNRINERRGWFRKWEGESWFCTRVVSSDAHKKVMYRYEAMRQAMCALQDPTDEDVKRTLDKYFPGDTYNQLIEQARLGNKQLQADLRRKVRNGDWLW